MDLLKDDNLSENLPDNNVLFEFGTHLSEKDWLNNFPKHIDIRPFDEFSHLFKPYKYMKRNLYEINEVLDNILEETANYLQSKLELEYFSDLDNLSNVNNTYIARVCLDNQNLESLKIEGTRFTRRRPKLQLSQSQDFTFFPGQIVALKGVNDNDFFRVEEIIGQNFIRPFSHLPIKLSSPLHIITANGPFTLPNTDDLSNLAKVLSHVRIYKPDLLLLSGPIFEPSNIIKNLNPETIFQKAIEMLQEVTDVTKVLIIPSVNDLHHFDVFPTPPYEGSPQNIMFFPNPSLININGLVIGYANIDIFIHLNKQMVERISSNKEGTRINRICELILSQNSFYPIYPTNSKINLEISKIKYFRFSTTPHIIIIPSLLKTFAKSVHGCVFVNPGKMDKNLISRIKINPPGPNQIGPIDQFVNVEILNLNK